MASPNTPLRLLALDGGGVRGYSEIIMLEAIMKRVQKLLKLDKVPLPADYFDLMGGTSTGGLIAIMLGRLRMSVEETVQAYELLSQQIFKRKGVMSKLQKKSRFDPELLKSVIQAVVQKKTGDFHAKLIEDRADACKIFVTAVCTKDVPHVRLLRSYDEAYSLEHDCEIWEAARATSAAPTYFAPIDIGPPGRTSTFLDGGLGCNNPIHVLHLEAERLFKSSRGVACIISLGTGKRKTNEIAEPTFVDNFVAPLKLIKGIKGLALDCERRAEDMDLKYNDMTDVYFRLTVEHGLENIKLDDWEQLETIRVHTMVYLEKPSVAKSLDSIATLLAGSGSGRQTYSLGQLSLSNAVVIATTTGLPPDYAATITEDQQSFYSNWFSSQKSGVSPSRDLRHNLSKRFVDGDANYSTCSWIFDTAQFQEFESSTNPLSFWIKGAPGSGKSVLASAVVDYLVASDGKNRVIYYYCSQHPVQTSFRDVLCSFLAQAAEWGNQQILELMQLFRLSHPTLGEPNDELDMILLQLLLEALSLDSPHKVYIVIDSVESCENYRRPIRLLLSLICRVKGTPKPSILFTSRSDSNSIYRSHDAGSRSSIKYQLKLLHLEMIPERTAQDLRALVRHRINDDDGPLGFQSQEQRDSITDTISNRAHGMFLYATLVLDELRGDRVASRSAVKATLRNLPEGISLMYQHQFEMLKGKRKAPEVFWWVYAAMRELSWDEVRSGIAVIEGLFDEDEVIDQPAEDFIRESCGLLVELSGENNAYLRFIHPTLKEVLSQPEGPGRLIQIRNAHSIVAEKLLAILMTEDVPDFCQHVEDPYALIMGFTQRPSSRLYSYAVQTWYKHLKACDSVTDQLQDTLAAFLSSPNSLKWIVAALVMSQHAQEALGDHFTLTRDVTDCLWGWMRGREGVIREDITKQVTDWSADFLNLMLDWGNVLNTEPCYVYSLHFDLLPKESALRQFVGTQTYQSVVRFGEDPIRTRSSMDPLWTNHVFAVDETRDWAYVYRSGYLQCFHTKTALLVAEVYLGCSELREGILSPDKNFIALTFAAPKFRDKQVDAYVSKIQQGLHLRACNTTRYSVEWCIEYIDLEDSEELFKGLVGERVEIDHLACLVQLNYEGQSRTHLFGLGPGMSSYTLKQWRAPVVWQIDEPCMLAFSSDSRYLSTPCGKTQLVDGTPTISWPVTQLTTSKFRSTSLSSNFSTIATIKGRRTLGLWDAESGSLRHSAPLEGVGHILTISSLGRYVLLLMIRPCVRSESPVIFSMTDQQGVVTVYDSVEHTWTDLCVLRPPMSTKSGPWAFQDNPCKASFASEGTGVRKLMVYLPAKWSISHNVHLGSRISDPDALAKVGHLLIFHLHHQAPGFPFRPILQHMIHLEPKAYLRDERVWSSQLDSYQNVVDNFHNPAVVSWSLGLEAWIIFFRGQMSRMSTNEFQTLVLSEQRRRTTLKQKDDETGEKVIMAASFVPSSRDMIFRLQLIRQMEHDHNLSSNRRADTNSARPGHRHHLRIERVGLHDNYPTTCSIMDIIPTGVDETILNSLNVTISDMGVLHIGGREFQLSFKHGSLNASAQFTNASHDATEAFAKACHPFQPSRARAFMSWLISGTEEAHYTLFKHTAPKLEGILPGAGIGRGNTADELYAMEYLVPVITKTCQEHLYYCEFSRLLHIGKQLDGTLREPRSFEVFICIYDDRRRELIWMVHTKTGGEINQSKLPKVQVAWALHPTLPLLAWSLPGQKLKISRIDSSGQPINIAEPVAFEGEPSESLSFSPNGRYLLTRGADTLCNFMAQGKPGGPVKSKISVLDLITGFKTILFLNGEPKPSIDLDNHYVYIHRVTRDNAVERNLLKLPDLVEIERFNLAYIPADCCCVTCGVTFQQDCDIFVQFQSQSVNIVMGHGTVHVGRGSLQGQACEPLILRAGAPEPSVDIEANDSFIPERSIGLCPVILDEVGALYKSAFTTQTPSNFLLELELDVGTNKTSTPGKLAKKARLETLHRLSRGIFHLSDSTKESRQLKQKLLLEFGVSLQEARQEAVKQPKLHLQDFKEVDNAQPLMPEQVVSVVRRLEEQATQSMAVTQTNYDHEAAFNRMMDTKLGRSLPFHTWDEAREASQLAMEDGDFRPILDKAWPTGNFGIGTQIPLPFHTFLFRQDGIHVTDRPMPHFQWSFALDVGWIQQDVTWWIQQMHQDGPTQTFPYIFPGMYRVVDRVQKLLTADTTEGEDARRVLSPFFSSDLRSKLGIPADGSHEGSQEAQAELVRKDKKTKSGEFLKDFDLEEYLDAMSESFHVLSGASPGFGEYMKVRLGMFMQDSIDAGFQDEQP